MSITRKPTCIIPLTDRAPVKIIEADWGEIACAFGFSGEHECQASKKWSIRVWQHEEDMRTIVHAVIGRGPGGMPIEYEGHAGGELLEPGADIAAAILRVGRTCGIPSATVRACLAELPAEEI